MTEHKKINKTSRVEEHEKRLLLWLSLDKESKRKINKIKRHVMMYVKLFFFKWKSEMVKHKQTLVIL